jgi:hypothetical protein
MPRPTPPGGPRVQVQTRLFAAEIDALEVIAIEQGYSSFSDTIRYLLAQADARFTAPERED